ncbi:hypothetical protein C8A03DRAFT_45623 [Achaetomium macrosporum]|uniref:Uncharacterized protein n=1 Tax=Achaetomium macrosporum TaxID=79813 RepID=A0AAN7HDC5_9PEZI|nr:hypothetical protein C8A03DRAFT_45623 [Achaetomium macrosporum]
MPHFAATLPLLATILALANGEEFLLSAVAQLPPTPAGPYAPAPPLPPNLPAATAAPHQQEGKEPSVFVLTQVPAGPAATGAAGHDDGVCDAVAARIKPQLTPKPVYPGPLQGLAAHMGGIQFDNCKDFSFHGGNANLDGTDRFKTFAAERYTTFLVPIWAKVHELWQACGDKTDEFDEVKNEPCYKWALEQCRPSGEEKAADDGVKDEGVKEKQPTASAQPVGGAAKAPTGFTFFGAAGRCGVSRAVAVGVAGVMAILWVVV